MDAATVEAIDVSEDIILRLLIDMLNHFSLNGYLHILEIDLLDKFSPYERISFMNFCPKHIIENMLLKHGEMMTRISEESDLLENITFKFDDDEDKKYTFSNNMYFYNDVVILCCLYHITIAPGYENSKPTMDILRMMCNKYGFREGFRIYYDPDPRIITLDRIACSFPSITLDIYHRDLYSSCINTVFAHVTLPEFNLAKVLVSSFIGAIIPRLDNNNTPIPLLTAIMVVLDNALKLDDSNHVESTLEATYRHIVDLYNSMAYPAELKLKLCLHWGIIVMDESEYKYSSYFSLSRQKAKDTISELRSEDPSLENILSKL